MSLRRSCGMRATHPGTNGLAAAELETRRPALTSTVEQGSGPRLRLLWPGPGIAPVVAFAGRSWLARTLSSGRAVASQAGGRRWVPPSWRRGSSRSSAPSRLARLLRGPRPPPPPARFLRSGDRVRVCKEARAQRRNLTGPCRAAAASLNPKVLSSLRSPIVATSFPVTSRDSGLSVTCKAGKDGL